MKIPVLLGGRVTHNPYERFPNPKLVFIQIGFDLRVFEKTRFFTLFRDLKKGSEKTFLFFTDVYFDERIECECSFEVIMNENPRPSRW